MGVGVCVCGGKGYEDKDVAGVLGGELDGVGMFALQSVTL